MGVRFAEESAPPELRTSPLLAVLRGKRVDPPPMWLMRQAGRYLPEYRELRQAKGSFLELVYDSDAAADVTLQPLKRFPLDAAILFSDILIVPFAIGQNLSFVTGEGPRLTPPLDARRARFADPVPDPARADLRNRPQGEGAAGARDRADRLCRQPVDGRHLHGRRPGQPRADRRPAASLIATPSGSRRSSTGSSG